MNFLAHLYLAEPGGLADGATLLGNLLPDLWRGRLPEGLPEPVVRGAERHRRVDRITDLHPAFVATVGLLRPGWGRFAAVAADVWFDHALSLRWGLYHPQPLPGFIGEVYRRLADAASALPPEVQRVTTPAIGLMIEQDWLSRYATLEGIRRTFEQMSHRFSERFGRPIDLAAPVAAMTEVVPAMVERFDAFFPEVVAAVSNEGV